MSINRLSAEKIFYHTDRLDDIKKRGDTFPIHVVIGLVNYCNHHCIFCHEEFEAVNNHNKQIMDYDKLLRFLREAKEYGLRAVTLVGAGEPTLYPRITELLYEMKKLGLDIGIFTNGSLVSGKLAEAITDTCTFVRFSISAGSSEEHEKVHRVKNQFDMICKNVKDLVNMRNSKGQRFPTIGTQMVFYSENYKTISKTAYMWKNIGVDYFSIKPVIEGEGTEVNVSVFSTNDENGVIQEMEKARQYTDDNYEVYAKYNQYKATVGNNERIYDTCFFQSLQMDLWPNGDLMLCCCQESEKNIIGNVFENSFIEVWNGEKRKCVLKNLNVKKCPRACVGHFYNEDIWDFIHPNLENHPNFI